MKLRLFLPYSILLLFFCWCFLTFRSDIAQVTFAPIFAAKSAMFLAAFLSLVNYALRIARWSMFLNRNGRALPLGFIGLTYVAGFAYTLSPGKVGELLRGKYYSERGVALPETAAAFFVERAMDLLAMLMLSFLAFTTLSAYGNMMLGIMIGIALLLCGLSAIPWPRVIKWAMQFSIPSGPLESALDGSARMLSAAQALLHPAPLIIGFTLGLVAWGAEGVGLMVVASLAPNTEIGWATATSIYAISVVAGALSFLPGGLGSTEAVMVGLLVAQNYPVSDAILITLVCRLLTLWLAVVLGWVAVACLRLGFYRTEKDSPP